MQELLSGSWAGNCRALVFGLVVCVMLATGCSTIVCSSGADNEPAVSLTYLSGGPAGLVEKIEYHEDGLLVLGAMNGKIYCSKLSPDTRREVNKVLAKNEWSEELEGFGDSLRYPSCFIQEDVTIELGDLSSTARIDALEGSLLDLVEILDKAAKHEFGRNYMTSILERATEQICRPKTDGAETVDEPEEMAWSVAGGFRAGGRD